MIRKPTAAERQEVLVDLQQVFDTRTSEILVRSLEKMTVWGRNNGETTREDFRALRRTVAELVVAQRELTQAQTRTEQRMDRVEAVLERLAQAQARTEQRVEELAQAQARTEQRLDRVEAAIERLAQAQARTEQRVEELAQAQARTEQRVEELAQAQARTEQRLDRVEAAIEQLAQAQTRTEQRLDRVEAAIEQLAQAQTRTERTIAKMQDRLGDVLGRQLEQDYRNKAYAYFGRLLRRVRVVSLQEIEDDLQRTLSNQEIGDLLPLDLLIRGCPRKQEEPPDVWLAVEISVVVDRHDVKRAQHRAALLQRAGYRAIPTVAGEQITVGAENMAHIGKVLILQDGKTKFWPEALTAATEVNA